MKKLLVFFLLFVAVTVVVFIPKKNVEASYELRGVFISYIEEDRYLSKDQVLSKQNIDKMIENLSSNHFNLIVLQVRSGQDAIYKSTIFPWSRILTGEEGKEYFDVLEYFIKKCHQNNILIYSWINPYRVRTTEDLSTISRLNPAYSYIGTDTLYINNGVFLNPSKREVEDLIVEGVEEIAKNYDVDGILFDDYFYPSDDIDIADYNDYISKNSDISLEDYHFMIINRMIKRVHSICNLYGKKFGISPDGNIENNYSYIYADIYEWLSSDEYVDFIMPQLYYGFYNEVMPYYLTVKKWDDSIKKAQIELIVALAIYKSGKEDLYAKSGRDEWIMNSNIIQREVLLARNLKHYRGFVLFRYDNLFTEEVMNPNSRLEFSNLEKILN